MPLSYPITVGMIPTIAPFLLPEILPVINERYPNSSLKLIEEQSHVLVDLVRNGEIDTAILALPYPCEGLLTLEFWQENFYWVTQKSEDNTLNTEVNINEIDQSKLMLLNDGHCLKEHILEICKLSEQRSDHGFGAASLTTLVHMVQGNLGTTLIPAMARKQLISDTNKLAIAHLNEPGPHRRIAFIFRPNYTRFTSIQALADICKKILSNL